MKNYQIIPLMPGVYELSPRKSGKGKDLTPVIKMLEEKMREMKKTIKESA
ncbi:hypothetical protein PJ311_19070 [Bacillus sp. CLL-7-23]|uniref:Uncharacterized protein n=1 Tax=Bacillus changyiensis TaxID=3004103 RepID=A0ABT4X8L4_9BACI|nr:hypothetical protein [Bacillus changyiensis]MDA7028637.1 hypothetical protein [Bacillus changyiensis]